VGAFQSWNKHKTKLKSAGLDWLPFWLCNCVTHYATLIIVSTRPKWKVSEVSPRGKLLAPLRLPAVVYLFFFCRWVHSSGPEWSAHVRRFWMTLAACINHMHMPICASIIVYGSCWWTFVLTVARCMSIAWLSLNYQSILVFLLRSVLLSSMRDCWGSHTSHPLRMLQHPFTQHSVE